jgi:hypothetical protein
MEIRVEERGCKGQKNGEKTERFTQYDGAGNE